jgi:hypothetical protein
LMESLMVASCRSAIKWQFRQNIAPVRNRPFAQNLFVFL